jgi:hypothetical protein
MIHTFVKDGGIWYIDLPEFLEAGLGSRGNLMMVAGADTFLDILDTEQSNSVTLELATKPIRGGGRKGHIIFQEIFVDREELKKYNHPSVEFGANYKVVSFNKQPLDHRMWLCPVTLYVFGGEYPKEIHFKLI